MNQKGNKMIEHEYFFGSNEVYYRIYLSESDKDEVCVVTMQYFDEIDYDQNKFLSNKKFNTEEEAINYINENNDKLPPSIYNPYLNLYKIKGILDR